MLAPLSFITFIFFIFLADLTKFFSESLSETIKAFSSLLLNKNLLKSLVLLKAFFTSDKIFIYLSIFFLAKV